VRCVVSCQARSKLRAAGTHVAVPFAGWPASSGTIVASPRRRVQSSRHTPLCRQPGIDVQLIKSSERHMECAYYVMLRLDTGQRRPHIRSYRRISRTLRRGSVAARGRSGSYECPGLRDARPLARGCSSDSFPNRYPPSVARAFRWESLSAAESLFHPKFRVFRLFRLVRVASLAL